MSKRSGILICGLFLGAFLLAASLVEAQRRVNPESLSWQTCENRAESATAGPLRRFEQFRLRFWPWASVSRACRDASE
jgi:hypothetical protein